MQKMAEGSLIILGFDRDPAGEQLSEEVQSLAPAGRQVRRILLRSLEFMNIGAAAPFF
jgi:hypothetical protein